MLQTSLGYVPVQPNLIINGDFQVAQRGVTFTAATTPANSDDTYLLDRWILLSDGNDIVDVSQVAVPFSRSGYGLKAEVETANKKFGFLQIFESSTCIPLRGKRISVSFAAKTATSKVINNIRGMVLEWTGTADEVTSDVVNAWSAQGTDPTLVASWAALNTPANLALATSETTYKVENLIVGASCTNLAVFIWVDDTDAAVDDLLYLGEVQLVRGSVVTPFICREFAIELEKCLQYFWKTFAYGVVPAQNSGSALGVLMVTNHGDTGYYASLNAHFPISMRTIPTVTTYNPNNAGTGFSYVGGTSNTACVVYGISEQGFCVYINGIGSANYQYIIHATASAEL